MIGCLIVAGLAFVWLGYETDWMRVHLLSGAYTPITEQPKRKWQFQKYGDDCIMMRDRCYIEHCNLCRQGDHFFTWRIPARTVKVAGSTINFKEGCNLYRAKLLKDIYKAQKGKALPTYKPTTPFGYNYDDENDIELLVDGKSIANINGGFKRGVIRSTLKPYTTKARVGRHTVTWDFGKADIPIAL